MSTGELKNTVLEIGMEIEADVGGLVTVDKGDKFPLAGFSMIPMTYMGFGWQAVALYDDEEDTRYLVQEDVKIEGKPLSAWIGEKLGMKPGDRFRAKVDTAGITKGKEYVIEDLCVQPFSDDGNEEMYVDDVTLASFYDAVEFTDDDGDRGLIPVKEIELLSKA